MSEARIKAVILDWAGTAVDHGSCAPAGVFRRLFARHGVQVSAEQAREPMGVHKRTHLQRMLEMPAVRAAWLDARGSAPGEADIDALYAELIPMQLAVLADYAEPVPGAIEALDALRSRGLRVGSSTGYNREMLDLLEREAAARGYAPDCAVSAEEVPEGRPAPWMIFENMRRLDAWPVRAVIKVGDTVSDIDAGHSAGVWTVGLALQGNEMGLSLAELEALDPGERTRRHARARARLEAAGAHYVLDRIGELPAVVDAIGARVARGERP